jgi:hypothetical protein
VLFPSFVLCNSITFLKEAAIIELTNSVALIGREFVIVSSK